MKRFFNLHRNVFFLGLVSLFNDFSVEMVQSVMPVFLSVILGVPPVGIGFIEGAADALASFVKVFSGWFSDKVHKRKIFAIFGYALSVATRFVLAFVSSFGQVFSLRLIDRMGKGVREGPRDALLAESVERGDLGKSFGYQRAMDALGGMLAPFAVFLILPLVAYSYRTLFLIAFGIGILAVFSFMFVRETHFQDGDLRPPLRIGSLRHNRSFLLYIGTVFLFTLGIFPITLMLLKAVEFVGETNALISFGTIPLIYFAYSFIAVTVAIPLGKLSDRIGQRRIILLGLLAALFSYIGLAFSHNFTLIIFFFALFGFYPAATDGIERALAAKLIDDRLLATGEGLLHMATGIGSLLAGTLGGLIWTFWGSQTALLYAAGMTFVGLIVFAWISVRDSASS